LDPNKKIIGLVPGSRLGEINRLLPIILESAQKLKQQFPNAQFVLPLASSLTEADIKTHLATTTLDIKVINNQTYDALHACDAIIATSGTVTLEIALLGVPMVIIYKIAPLIGFFGMLLFKVKYFGLCNVISEKSIIKELIQSNATPDNICQEITRILKEDLYCKRIKNDLQSMREKLLAENADASIGQLSNQLLS